MENHPIESLMQTSMVSLEEMIDVNKIVGDVIKAEDGTIIIPVSKLSFGFAAGGSEFNSNKLNKFSDKAKLPFGGGSGGGVSITPEAFLVVKDSKINLLSLNNNSPIDKLVDTIPDVVNKLNDVVNKMVDKKPKEIIAKEKG